MLVLSRKKSQSVQIAGDLITVTVVEIRGDKVRLGITAPRNISVHRSEIQDLVNEQASETIDLPESLDLEKH